MELKGKTAVVTGGGSGMGRELCVALAKGGCAVAACDLAMDKLQETKSLCEAAGKAPMTVHQCDVSVEAEILAFRDQVKKEHGEALNLLFNNAGIAGGGTMASEEARADWERTFNICFYGVYWGCRAFMPMLLAAKEAHIINTSSVNGFWAFGGAIPHTAYCAAKHGVKGLSEALITDLRMHAPHVKVSVVMPGHIGTDIAINSGKRLGHPDPLEMPAEAIKGIRQKMMEAGGPQAEALMNLSDGQLREQIHQRGIDFRDQAPVSAKEAAAIILDGVAQGKWRILVGEDAQAIDRRVRKNPEGAYEPEFLQALVDSGEVGTLFQDVQQDLPLQELVR